ncbi:hypothetical protein [Planotetraspora kaengkrachanensis]|uniref:hypothetical protein n=1 Tax=Planotetraspora kaengkrachanensis TaxID=575193 RepID=UPI001EF1FB80|nr:hypothetical protein [Planotetraspora kaengkrachanensis]
MICPDCQRARDLDLDACPSCGSTSLIRRLGEVECRSCGSVRQARPDEPNVASANPAKFTSAPGLPAEVAAALDRVLGRS